MKTENTMPLYKALNSERTQGVWSTKPNELTPTQIVLETETNVIGQISLVDVDTDHEAEANAQYTALAVNNLSPIADALLLIKEVLESWNGEGKYTNLINHADNALSKIS